jgi:hypothetical protein
METSPDDRVLSETICSKCKSLNLRKFLNEHEDPCCAELGEFQEISERKNCTFCSLIIQALSASSEDCWQDKVYPVETVYLGRVLSVSGAPRLVTWFHATSLTLPRGWSGHSTTYGEILLAKRTYDPLQDMKAGLGRLVKESSADFSLIRTWMDFCENQHGPTCNPDVYNPHYIRLLDLKRMCLVSGLQKYRYFALSYVWGDMVTFQTLKSNLSELKEGGSIIRMRDKLPRVISDAISVVSVLQERYLWIDALCVVQDDPEDKQALIPHMDVIYRQAVATIVALSGQDASAGLPGVRPNYRNSRLLFTSQNGIPVLGPSKKEYCQGDVCTFQMIRYTSNVSQSTIQKTLMRIRHEEDGTPDSRIHSTRRSSMVQTLVPKSSICTTAW